MTVVDVDIDRVINSLSSIVDISRTSAELIAKKYQEVKTFDSISTKMVEEYSSLIDDYHEVQSCLMKVSVANIDARTLVKVIQTEKYPPTILNSYKVQLTRVQKNLESVKEAVTNISKALEARIRFYSAVMYSPKYVGDKSIIK